MEIENVQNIGMNQLSSCSSQWSIHSFDSNPSSITQSNQIFSGLLQKSRDNKFETDNIIGGNLSTPQSEQKKKRKYIKKSIEKFLSLGKKGSSEIISAHEIESKRSLSITPIYNHITEKIDFILIGGDFFYKLNLSEEERDLLNSLQKNQQNFQSEEEKNSALQLIQHTPEIMNQYKEILEIQKHDKYLLVRMSNKIDGLKEFQNLISQLNQASQILVGDPILHPLIELQKIIKGCQGCIQSIIQSYQNDNERLLTKQEKRNQFIEKAIKGLIKSKKLFQTQNDAFCQEVFTVGFISIDFTQCIPVLRKILYSSQYINIMGCTLDEAVTQFIRQGIKEMYDLKTRMKIQQAYIQKVLQSNSDSPIIIQEMNILTFDNISIQCSGEVSLIPLDIPTQLKYNESNPNENLLEQAYLLKLNVPKNIYNQVDLYRKSLKQGQQQYSSSSLLEQEEFRYSIQSQVFIEKFYQNQQESQDIEIENNENLPTSQNIYSQAQCESKSSSEQHNNSEEDQTKSSRCKFKLIS
ncbi:hypothetical protein TTHERM_00726280 (macronuclear) [Tetrahymena thermophila SB210]|uniref:Uncharacterized protein n=1 Tax=Tetrahymena thermophila (strain SB210) TaxID=312017 RepID=Q24GG3_TETTS|nr:hypothetical protein TTHERM_00726280 [Tetrahymena thermophila SB210]EAS06908.1 hypothetical protein TTHERM_00726280 [Tetrahymena thermophila SB210]|eukprot:XP_001027150.1 hypothetical protein TTHERM_00726280 [Tetrahymena thermophila SB210]